MGESYDCIRVLADLFCIIKIPNNGRPGLLPEVGIRYVARTVAVVGRPASL